MFLLVLNNDSDRTAHSLPLPPVVSNTVTVRTMAALWWQCQAALTRGHHSPHALQRLPQLHICHGLMGKQTRLRLMSSCITSHLWSPSISLSQNLWNVMDSSKPLISILPIASSGTRILRCQDLRFQSDSQFHRTSLSHYYANASFTWRQALSS